jgi:urea transport system permease protein
MRRIAVFLLAVGVLWTAAAEAAELEDAVNSLAGKSFKARIAAVERIAATGDARAVPVLEALISRRLFFLKADKSVIIAEKKGGVYIAKAPLSQALIGKVAKKDIKKIRVNNRLRGIIRGAIGGLTLLSPDPSRRRLAANAVFKSRRAALLPVVEKALARETEARVKSRLERTLAAIRATSLKKTEPRLKAIAVLAGFADPDIRSLLDQLAGAGTKDRKVRAAAAAALKKVDDKLALWAVVENIFQGVSLGSVLMLAAIGLAITFGVMGVINMAHGELVMIGAYTTFVVQELFRAYMPNAFDYSLFAAIPAAFVVAGLFGIAIERGIIRFLYGRPLETLLATWGLSLVLQQLVRSVFGPTNRDVSSPGWMSGAIETAGGLTLTYNRIWIIVFSLMVFGLLALLLRKTTFGLQMRAVTQNRRMAASMGIRTGRIDALTFGLGSGIAGIAGVALSQIDNVSPNLGQAYIIDSFMVVVFGGVGNLWGTLVGGFSLGVIDKFLEPFTGAVLAKILVLVAIILFIQKRPRGLFALKGRAVES